MLCNGSQGVITRLSDQGLPVVKFSGSTSGHSFETVMGNHVWPSENIPGVGVSQIPLILAWALTIHKSQGATLDIAEIDAGSGIFECGQTYVALSRVKSLDGLYLTSFDASRIKVSRKVQEFYSSISNVIKSHDIKEANATVTAIPIVEAIPISDDIAYEEYYTAV
jgi:ATP-dependent DNA helicase PIF1